MSLPMPIPTEPESLRTASIQNVMLTKAAGDTTLIFSPLTLPINPQKVSISRQSKVEGVQTMLNSDFENAVKATGKLVINLNDIWLVGQPFVVETLNTLFALVSPWPSGQNTVLSSVASARSPGATWISGQKSAAVGEGMQAVTNTVGGDITGGGSPTLQSVASSPTVLPPTWYLPLVQLTWGNGLAYTVNVTNVSAEITKMSMIGEPIEARVNLQVTDWPHVLPGTNPTSGGPVGRGQHTVVAGDNIVRIAASRCGDPKAWRAIAAANGLDNALRLTAGRTLFLPGRADMAALDAARRSEVVLVR
jgi:nucleoid-associated protein YgaU